jgi:hypothetical protein
LADEPEEPPDFLQPDLPDNAVPFKKYEPTTIMGDAAPAITGELDEPPKRRRGRPKGSKNRPRDADGKLVSIVGQVTKRDDLDKIEKKVAERAKAILLSATGVIAVWRPHWQMTDQEADHIVEPGASWVRSKSGENITVVEDWLDQFDLIAVGLALLAYMIRVLREEQQIANQRRIEHRNESGRQRPDTNSRFARNANGPNRPTVEPTQGTQETEQESGGGVGDTTTYSDGFGVSAPRPIGN